MTKPKTLNDRVLEAKMMASLAKVESRDSHGRVKTVLVPASDATINHVIIRRFNSAIISCECRKQAGGIGYVPCNGNLAGVCRHSLAAIFVAMGDNGYTPRFRRDLNDAQSYAKAKAAELLSNPDTGNPIIFTLKSHAHAKNYLFFVAQENSAVELKRHSKSIEPSWMGCPPESSVLGSDSLDRELARLADRVDTFGWGGK